MAQRPTAIFADQIDDLALGNGLGKNGADDTIAEVDIKVNDGLVFDTAELTVAYDDSTIGIISNELAVKDEGITEAKLDMFNAPTVGYFLGYTSNGLEWVANTTPPDVLEEDDYVANEVPSGTIGGGNPTFTIANSPVAGSVMVYLNGLLQAPGSALDYTISGTTITFNKAPRPNSELLVSYFIDEN